MSLNIVILAAGQGKRMASRLPKVLHPLAGKPLLAHVLETACALNPRRLVVVVGHGGDAVRAHFADTPTALLAQWIEQKPQLGTGHAVLQALPLLDKQHPTLVLYGDVPLIRPESLRRLQAEAQGDALALITAQVTDAAGYGRIVRNAERSITRIVEDKDATETERRINEINTGILIAPTARLADWLPELSAGNAQGEYYLTDIIARAVGEGLAVNSIQPDALWEVEGVNSRAQLAELERIVQRNQAAALLEQGVTLLDPTRFDLRGSLRCGRDVSIDVGCVFSGEVSLDDNVTVGPYCVIEDALIGAGARIEAMSHIQGATIGEDTVVGPFARLRPGAKLADAAHVGNFVEIKNSSLGAGSKANHLSYLGDASIGERVNIGAGTITCNYDGVNKHRTVIEDDAFIGSDSQLVAPVTVGRGATLGAGTTLTRDAPPQQLTVTRVKAQTLPAWRRPAKKSST